MNRALRNVGWRYLLRHPWQTGLMILGIALGVSVMVAIDLANSAASRGVRPEHRRDRRPRDPPDHRRARGAG